MSKVISELEINIDWVPMSCTFYAHANTKSVYDMAVKERKLLPPRKAGYGGLVVKDAAPGPRLLSEFHFPLIQDSLYLLAHEAEHLAQDITQHIKYRNKPLWNSRVEKEDEIRAYFTGAITSLVSWFNETAAQERKLNTTPAPMKKESRKKNIPKKLQNHFYTALVVCFPELNKELYGL